MSFFLLLTFCGSRRRGRRKRGTDDQLGQTPHLCRMRTCGALFLCSFALFPPLVVLMGWRCLRSFDHSTQTNEQKNGMWMSNLEVTSAPATLLMPYCRLSALSQSADLFLCISQVYCLANFMLLFFSSIILTCWLFGW